MSSPTTSSWSGWRRNGALFLVFACRAPPAIPLEPTPNEAVDVFIGTGGPGFRVGSATPAAGAPFGLVKVGPDTSLDGVVFEPYHCSGYYYDDNTIEGFSHLHLHGVGVPDYGAILVMPTLGYPGDWTREEQWATPFVHEDEAAGPGWYRVRLANGILAELAATEHTGVHRYTFPEGQRRALLFDLEHVLGGGTTLGGELGIDPDAGTISGWMVDTGSFTGGYGGFPVYFHAEVEGGFTWYGTWGDDAPTAGRAHATGVDLGGWIEPLHNPAVLRVGISLTGLDGARRNLEQERTTSLESAAAATGAQWAALLGRVEVDTDDDTARTILYTSIYHLLQMPTLQSDVDGTYRGFDHLLHRVPGRMFYSDFSMWDTYRTAHPAYSTFVPEYAARFADSLVRMRVEGGAFPRWPAASGEGGSMLGAPADTVLADTWLRGVEDWDIEAAWPLLRAQAMGEGDYPYNARPDPSLVTRYGYYPSDTIGGSVAWTQELAWADKSLAGLAVALGHLDDAALFEHRSYSYLNQFDPATGFFRGRDSAGAFAEGFNEIAWEEDYVEGNAWQYLWMPAGHADATAVVLGGEEAARERLLTFMEGAEAEGLVAGPAAYYWQGNEPDIHAPFLFGAWGDPDATSTWQRWVEDERYYAAPDGLAGNDDAGTLSAWYLYSILGLHPVAGTDRYFLGVPRFAESRFAIGEGWFTVVREGPEHTPGSAVHVEEVALNGVVLDRPWLRQRELVADGRLVVRVSAR